MPSSLIRVYEEKHENRAYFVVTRFQESRSFLNECFSLPRGIWIKNSSESRWNLGFRVYYIGMRDSREKKPSEVRLGQPHVSNKTHICFLTYKALVRKMRY